MIPALGPSEALKPRVIHGVNEDKPTLGGLSTEFPEDELRQPVDRAISHFQQHTKHLTRARIAERVGANGPIDPDDSSYQPQRIGRRACFAMRAFGVLEHLPSDGVEISRLLLHDPAPVQRRTAFSI